MILPEREHGGDLDRAVTRYGGRRSQWLDLSTGINPTPYPVPELPSSCWTDLPDKAAFAQLEAAARSFWNVPDDAQIVIGAGASALIAALPTVAPRGPVHVSAPTYNEHAAAFRAAGFEVVEQIAPPLDAQTQIVVHPNNPDGRLHDVSPQAGRLTIVDESFADIGAVSHVGHTDQPGFVVLKSFGKFWGLAGLRLGFAICDEAQAVRLRQHLGPWAASGPALQIGTAAFQDHVWAEETRAALRSMAEHLDRVMRMGGAHLVGGTTLFRLYEVGDAASMQSNLAQHRIWTRIFEEHPGWIRLGLPADAAGLERIARALA